MIDYVDELACSLQRRIMVRLVKGAYWDTEIKRAQERGLDDFPVFTRKAMTDLNYIHCARKLLALRPRLFPQFATHNALTVATVLELGSDGGFEFQRLHGMGEALYARLERDHPKVRCRTYAPVGSHRDLLAYLVRRLLENGANSSFVAIAADESPALHFLGSEGAVLFARAIARYLHQETRTHDVIGRTADLDSHGIPVFLIACQENRSSLQNGVDLLLTVGRMIVLGVLICVRRHVDHLQPERLDAEPVPVPTPAEMTLRPGAITSGFGAESGLRGPPDEKLVVVL